MDTERGVYVISVNALGSVLRDYIRPNDVILELGGKTVNNLADLQKTVQETDLKQPQTMVIFRSQKENKLTLPGNLLKWISTSDIKNHCSISRYENDGLQRSVTQKRRECVKTWIMLSFRS